MTVLKHKKPLAILGGALVLLVIAGFSGSQYIKAHTVDFVQVYRDGLLIGDLSSQDQVNALISRKQEEITAANPNVNMVVETGEVTYEHKSAYKAEPQSEATLAKLESLITSHATGVELKVNGKTVGIVKDQATADSLLKQVENKFAPQEAAKAKSPQVKALSFNATSTESTDKPTTALKSVKILEKVETETADVQPKDIADPDALYLKLVKGTVTPTKYTVQKGDCIGCIAAKFNISPQVIYERNNWIEDDMIKEGEVLDLSVLKPQVTVETVENVTETLIIEPSTVVQKNSNMKIGESKVIREGKSGKKTLLYQLVKQNGYLMKEVLVSEQVLQKTIPEIVMKGTKLVGEGTGSFSWPVSGHTVTSSFGGRWGSMHKGLDMVGDKDVMAADTGVVSFAGEKSGYGNCVIINHKNGYETLYGHLSKISVKVGQTLEKGDVLGIMGNTGHSFGTHLHFEIHKDGDLQNPIKYL
ncbi:peptidoglycan DD-metalloendopeptidase family protein [Paenibacillus sepulcri]|uniref:M23 family metallopeptidase n=1 Tax=Paenibacillus sepulcri TaxID=359917 RepID=A0ABS7CAJ5_9BACL|nr:M23 family metallopeptidase [Paenibacillus sepulcri]